MVPAWEYIIIPDPWFAPIQSSQHYNRDSDNKSNYRWYHDYQRDVMEDLTNVVSKKMKEGIHMMLKARAPNASQKDDFQPPPFDLSNFGKGHKSKIVSRSETGQHRNK